MNNHTDTKLKAYTVVGALGVAVILLVDVVYVILNKGIKMISYL